MTAVVQRVGRIPAALALIAYGTLKVTDSFRLTHDATRLLLKFWPVLMVAIGAEYLLRSAAVERHAAGGAGSLRFDAGGVGILVLAVALGSGVGHVQQAMPVRIGAVATVGAPALSDSYPTAGVRLLRVSTPAGRIEITPAPGPQVEVHATASISYRNRPAADLTQVLQAQRLQGSRNGDELVISLAGPDLADAARNGLVINYFLAVPEGISINAQSGAGPISVERHSGDLTLRSGAGDIRVFGGSGTLDLSGSAGFINVGNHEGAVTANNDAGGIEVNSTKGDLKLQTGAGPIRVQEFAGALAAAASSGSVSASTQAPLLGDVSLRTNSGGVSLNLPAGSSMHATIRNDIGRISAPQWLLGNVQRGGPGRPHTLDGTQGDGRYRVTLETLSGVASLYEF